MQCKIGLCALIIGLALIARANLGGPSAVAQDDPDAWTTNGLNMRAGPGPDFEVVVVLPPDTGLVFEGRNADQSWLLGHTENGVFRGWIASRYPRYREGFSAESLPETDEVISVLAAPSDSAPAMAVVSAWTRDNLNVRQGPGSGYPILHMLTSTTGIVLEGRNSDGRWILGHTAGGSVRGWMDSRYLYFREDIELMLLAVLTETMPAPPPTPTPIPPPAPVAAPAGIPAAAALSGSTQVSYQGRNQSYSPARIASINLGSYPIVPSSLGQARAIFLQGQSRGANRHVVSKVGDCASYLHHFLTPFGHGGYNLGNYGYLQGVIGHFSGSLSYTSFAAAPGFVAGAVLDSTWADPSACQPGESPLRCEYRIRRPSAAVIMFGTQDVFLTSPEQFDSFMRQIVYETIQAGAIPILSTFPSYLSFWDNTILFNKIVIRVALDYNIPLVNLWLALEPLPNHGLTDDGNHLTTPAVDGHLTDPHLQTGHAMRNLVTLQALDAVWRGAMY